MFDAMEERNGFWVRWALTPSLLRMIERHPLCEAVRFGRVPYLEIQIESPASALDAMRRINEPFDCQAVEMRRHTVRVTQATRELEIFELFAELEQALTTRGMMTRRLSRLLYDVRVEINTLAPPSADPMGGPRRCECAFCRERGRRHYDELLSRARSEVVLNREEMDYLRELGLLNDPAPRPPRPPSKLHPLVQQDERDRAPMQEPAASPTDASAPSGD